MEVRSCLPDFMDCYPFGQDGIYFVEKILRVIERTAVRQVKVGKIVHSIDPRICAACSRDGDFIAEKY